MIDKKQKLAIAKNKSLGEKIKASLADAKAQDILIIDISGRSSIADFIIIASGTSHRHVHAICNRLLRDLKNAKITTPHIEGLASGDWVLIDIGDIIVHVFMPQVREFYSLEKIWQSIKQKRGKS